MHLQVRRILMIQQEGKEYVFNPETTIGIIYGEETAPFESKRVAAIRDLFDGTGLNYRVTEHIKEEIWSKYRLNICNNLPQAIIGAGVGCYTDSEHMKAISEGLNTYSLPSRCDATFISE